MATKQERFMEVVMAFQRFAGKPLRAIDSAKALSEEQLDAMESGLLAAADALLKEDAGEWPELHALGCEILKRIRDR